MKNGEKTHSEWVCHTVTWNASVHIHTHISIHSSIQLSIHQLYLNTCAITEEQRYRDLEKESQSERARTRRRKKKAIEIPYQNGQYSMPFSFPLLTPLIIILHFSLIEQWKDAHRKLQQQKIASTDAHTAHTRHTQALKYTKLEMVVASCINGSDDDNNTNNNKTSKRNTMCSFPLPSSFGSHSRHTFEFVTSYQNILSYPPEHFP